VRERRGEQAPPPDPATVWRAVIFERDALPAPTDQRTPQVEASWATRAPTTSSGLPAANS
jgi:hypothetical protein